MASLMQDLQRALTLEAKFQPRLQLPTAAANGGVSVTANCVLLCSLSK